MENTKKICLITGATSGIGKALSIKFAQYGYNLILLGRNDKVGNNLCSLLKMKYDIKSDFHKTDISSLKEVSQIVNKIKTKYERIDVQINNAGARFDKPLVSEDGFELTFAANYLGHFLLTLGLLDIFKTQNSGNIINITSNAHYGKNNTIEHLLIEKTYNRHTAYGKSKLALIMFTYHLAQVLSETKITVNAYDPGYVATNFTRNNGILPWIKFRIIFLLKEN